MVQKVRSVRSPRVGPILAAVAALSALAVVLVTQSQRTVSAQTGATSGNQRRAPQSIIAGVGPDRNWGDFSPKPPVTPLTPEEQATRFLLPPGYRMELVLSEPDIIVPTEVTFDGNGRMYVVEMRSYMRDVDASDEYTRISRISRHESSKGDGRYDRHTVFIDNLLLPRMAAPLDDSILTMETDSNDVYRYWDSDGDGTADKQELFFSGAGRKGNLEHQPSGFIWALDNWIYSTYNAFRIRWTPQGVRTGLTARNYGQWGLTQDDYGKVWFVDAGGERGPINFQTPIQYGAFNVSDQFEDDFEVVWPAPTGVADMQGGQFRVRMPIGVLNHFTATCGQAIFRGDRLPADLRGDLLFAEPVGRLIRRAKIEVSEGLTQLQNAYPGSEFILSTDPLFRPVNMTTAPDGTLYIVDMYHGIVQESEWVRPGSYLRRKIAQHQLDKVVSHGRIWRLVHESTPPSVEQPRMLEETPAQLVKHLAHPNGWWRDTAQRLLVLRQDTSVVPTLQDMTRNASSLLARFHAMWTLEGLEALDAALVRGQMKDGNAQMRVQAIRASESLYKAGDRSFEADYRQLTKDKDTNVVIQALLTLNHLKAPDVPALVRAAQNATPTRGVREIGDQILEPPMSTFGGGGFRALTAEQRGALEEGSSTYAELCSTCHGNDGKGAAMAGAPAGTKMAPPLAGSRRVQGHHDYVIKPVLHGMEGPIDGSTYAGVMVPMASNDDAWVAAVASYVRSAWGNAASFVSPADVARARAATERRSAYWTVDELEGALPRLLPAHASWKVTASHNAQVAGRALALSGPTTWTSGAPQRAGMWWQVELPSPVTLSEIQFESPGRVRWPSRPAPVSGSAAGTTASSTGPAVSTEDEEPALPVMVPGSPRGYTVQVSPDGHAWGAPVARGQSNEASTTTVMAFPPTRGRFVRITLTADDVQAPAWSIQRLRLYEPPKATRTR